MKESNDGLRVVKAVGLGLLGAAIALGLEHREDLADKAKPLIKDLNKQVKKLPHWFRGRNIFSTLRGK
jgi:hypothetical protein